MAPCRDDWEQALDLVRQIEKWQTDADIHGGSQAREDIKYRLLSLGESPCKRNKFVQDFREAITPVMLNFAYPNKFGAPSAPAAAHRRNIQRELDQVKKIIVIQRDRATD